MKEYAAIARFFRAWFYFEKVKRFGDVPFYSTAIGVRNEENLQKARDPRTLVMGLRAGGYQFRRRQPGSGQKRGPGNPLDGPWPSSRVSASLRARSESITRSLTPVMPSAFWLSA